MSTVCVNGLGSIDPPTAAMLASNGHEAVRYDSSEAVIERSERGSVSPDDPGHQTSGARAFDSGSFPVGTGPTPAEHQRICVPSANTASNEADLQYARAVEAADRVESAGFRLCRT